MFYETFIPFLKLNIPSVRAVKIQCVETNHTSNYIVFDKLSVFYGKRSMVVHNHLTNGHQYRIKGFLMQNCKNGIMTNRIEKPIECPFVYLY